MPPCNCLKLSGDKINSAIIFMPLRLS
jgi:hypothetical protein